jgi:hypothetical protein
MSKIIDQCPICSADFMYDPSTDDALIQEIKVNDLGETQPMYVCQHCSDNLNKAKEILFKLDDKVSDFIKNMGARVTLADGREFYYVPYWFSPSRDNLYRMYSFDELPREVKNEIISSREIMKDFDIGK